MMVFCSFLEKNARCSFFRHTRKRAGDPREDPRTQDPKEDPIIMDPKEDPKENPMDEGPITEDHIIHKKSWQNSQN